MMKPKFVCTSMFSKCLELDFMWKKNIYEKNQPQMISFFMLYMVSYNSGFSIKIYIFVCLNTENGWYQDM
jgi:hypothetical protein